MICPNCKVTDQVGYMCENCGVDMVLFSKSLKISIGLYNKGLQKAGQMDLTGAVEVLLQAIEFDKNNYTARNLLGIVYYEIGQVGDALKQWIISSNLVKRNNLAEDYIAKLQSNPDALYKKNDAVELYNSAFIELDDKNITGAISYLQKSLEINGHFVEALNLLAFCYLILENRDEAINTISRVLKIDRNNEKAINYNFILTGQKARNQVTVGTVPVKITNPVAPAGVSQYSGPVPEPRSGFRVIDLTHIVSFVIGAGIVFAMLYYFVMPGWVGDMENEINSLNSELIGARAEHAQVVVEHTSTVSDLEGRNQEQASTIGFLQDQLGVFIQNQTITDVQALVYQGEYITAADMLFNIDMSIVTPDRFTLVSELREEVFVIAARELYERGYQEYMANNLIIAQGFFTTSLRYTDQISEPQYFVDDAIFFLGRIAMLQGDYQLALANFNVVINNHPNANVYNSARAGIAEVEQRLEALAVGEHEEDYEDE